MQASIIVVLNTIDFLLIYFKELCLIFYDAAMPMNLTSPHHYSYLYYQQIIAKTMLFYLIANVVE